MQEIKEITIDNDKIDIIAFLIHLWNHKFLISLTIVFFLLGSIYYISKSEKIYTATSIFSVEVETNTSSFATGLERLIPLKDFSVGTSFVETLVERVSAREFVFKIINDLNLRRDAFFNAHTSSNNPPNWKTAVKTFIGWDSEIIDRLKIADSNTFRNYKRHVEISTTRAGSIKVQVKHKDPKSAAMIANFIVEKVILMVKDEKSKFIKSKISYLSETLADSKLNYEKAQKKLKDFFLNNSTQVNTSFSVGSVLLDDLRKELDKSQLQIKTIGAIKYIVIQDKPSQKDFEELRKSFPLVDQPAFRRILGISETVSAWTWPRLQTLTQVEDSIRDRMSTLRAEILSAEKDAFQYANSVEDLAKLERDLQIAESTYTVLIEQVKTQSLSAGFSPDNSRIIALADIPIAPSEPKKMIILGLGAVMGLVTGVVLSFLWSAVKGTCNSLSSLLNILEPKFFHRVKKLSWYKASTLRGVQYRVSKRPPQWPKRLFLETGNTSKSIALLVVDTTGLNYASLITRVLGVTLGQIERSTAIINLSDTVRSDSSSQKSEDTELEIVEQTNDCTEYVYANSYRNIEWLFSKNFDQDLTYLLSRHDLVLISSNLDTFEMVLSSSLIKRFRLITFCSAKRTKKALAKTIKNRANTEVFLHD
jgi:uncharacterized protein involved in exopolysaccharide biosynthesis